VPDKELDQELFLFQKDGAKARVHFWLHHNGKTVIDYVLQVEIKLDDKTYTVRRYDCAHGHPHCDVYDHQGNHYKIWVNGKSRKEAWDAAVQEVNEFGFDWAMQFLDQISKEK
jgi:hypothetical protein